jgi:CRISPR-associated protein Csm1
MLIVGDISGINEFVTNVAHVGGGQAKRLRARSFYVQLLCDVAAVRILHELGISSLDSTHFPMSAAGHFVLRVEARPEHDPVLTRLAAEMSAWLLSELSGEVRLHLAWTSAGTTEMEAHREAHRQLNRARLRPWEPIAFRDGEWDTGRLVLDPLAAPCQLCRQRNGEVEEIDENRGQPRTICRLCDELKKLGAALTRAKWLCVSKTKLAPASGSASIRAFGLFANLLPTIPPPSASLAVASLDHSLPAAAAGPFSGRLLSRSLARHVPSSGPEGRTLDFEEIARRSTGDAKLGILKADGDGMGEFWSTIFQSDIDLSRYCAVSKEVDTFSAVELNELLRGSRSENPGREPWRFIYSVYSGGDDLLYLGPWDVILDFAGQVRRIFEARFAQYGLTLSAGLAIVKPGSPIRQVAHVAEKLLRRAKTTPPWQGEPPKGQIAALGAVWKWSYHDTVIGDGKRWASWVRQRALDRGWLERIWHLNEAHKSARRQITEDRAPEDPSALMASARLSYSISRLIDTSRRVRQDTDLVSRLTDLVNEFESHEIPRARYLSATLHYAILSTRSRGAENLHEMG